jgi:uncharacterized protein YkwD
VIYGLNSKLFFARHLALLGIASACLFGAVAGSASADARTDCAGVDATYDASNLAALRTSVICLTNRERVARGMAALNEEPHLDAAAQGHSEDMAQNNYFDHTDLNGGKPWDRTKAAGYPSEWVGENIAAGYRSPFLVMTGWMKSAGHCQNILNSPYVDIGVGVAKVDGSKFGTYWTMVLGGHNSSAAVVAVTCPYPGLNDGAVPVVRRPGKGETKDSKTTAKVTSVKRQRDGRYLVKGKVTPAASGVAVVLTVKRGKKSKTFSVTTDSAGTFSKTLRAPRGRGKVRVRAKLSS